MNQKGDVEQLRNDLKDYYGTAMFGGFPMAMIELSQVERASDEEVINMAKDKGKLFQIKEEQDAQ